MCRSPCSAPARSMRLVTGSPQCCRPAEPSVTALGGLVKTQILGRPVFESVGLGGLGTPSEDLRASAFHVSGPSVTLMCRKANKCDVADSGEQRCGTCPSAPHREGHSPRWVPRAGSSCRCLLGSGHGAWQTSVGLAWPRWSCRTPLCSPILFYLRSQLVCQPRSGHGALAVPAVREAVVEPGQM